MALTNSTNTGSANSRFGIGTTSPDYILEVKNSSATPTFATSNNLVQNVNTFTSYGEVPSLLLRSSRGDQTAPSATGSGDVLGQVAAVGYGNSGFGSFFYSGNIQYIATQNFSNTATGTAINILTTPNNSVTPASRIYIDQTGFVGIGSGTTTPSNLLTLSGGASTVTLFSDTASGTNAATFASYGANASSILTRSSVGTKASATATVATNSLGKFGGMGTIGANSFATAPTGYMEVIATDTTFSSGDQGTRLDFYTTTNGSATPHQSVTISSNKRVGINTSTPDAMFHINKIGLVTPNGCIHTEADGNNTMKFDAYNSSDGTLSAQLYTRCARGNIGGGTATSTNDILGVWGGIGGYVDASVFSFGEPTASISFTATQAYTLSNQGAKITFGTAPNNSTTIATRMTIDQTGFVGIGNAATTTPAALLNVAQTSATTTLLTQTNGVNTVRFQGYSGQNANLYFDSCPGTIATPGSTASPSAQVLHYIVGRGYTGSAFADGSYIRSITTQLWTGANNGTKLDFWTTANNSATPAVRMTIDQTGFVGIGNAATTTPAALLNVAQTSAATTLLTQADGQNIVSIQAYTGSFANLTLDSCPGTRATPGSTGSPSAASNRIDFRYWNGSAFANGAHIRSEATQLWTGSNNGTRLEIWTTSNNTTNPQNRMTVDQSGFVGIAVSSPSHQFQLNNDDGYKTTTNLWIIPSDERIKTDIQDVTEALSLINALKPRTFKYTQEHVAYHDSLVENGECGSHDYCPHTTYYGFIADEVHEVVPSCVKESKVCSGEHENLKTFNPHNIYILTVKAVQELSAANDILTTTNEALTAALAALSARVAALEI